METASLYCLLRVEEEGFSVDVDVDVGVGVGVDVGVGRKGYHDNSDFSSTTLIRVLYYFLLKSKEKEGQ